MRHLDLFSGIGGWALASREVWPEREMVGFVEIDPFCQKVLAKHFPNVRIHGDIKTLCPSAFGRIDLLTGSPPCQAASFAGQRRGTSDDRWLWDEYVRTVCVVRPTFFVAENVLGVLSVGGGVPFESVLTRLEMEGYETVTIVLPACAVNAIHRRDRVWVVGHAKHDGRDGAEDTQSDLARADGDSKGQKQVCQSQRTDRLRPFVATSNADWSETTARTCRINDGLSRRMDRARRLKALGNSIVPQVAVEVLRGIGVISGNGQTDLAH